MSTLTPRINKIEASDNALINGAMDFWQRHTSSATLTPDSMLADRWILGNNMGGSPLNQRSTDVPTNSQAQYSLHMQGTPSAGGQRFFMSQRIESTNARRFVNKTVTCSFKYKGSMPDLDTSASVTYLVIRTPSVADNYTSNAIQTTLPLSGLIFDNTWRTASFTFDTTSFTNVHFGMEPLLRVAATAATTQWNLYVTEWSLTETDAEVPFKRAGKTIAEELAFCQRYYEKTFLQSVPVAQNSVSGAGALSFIAQLTATVAYDVTWNFAVAKRSTPTVLTYNPGAANANWNPNPSSPTATVASTGERGVTIRASLTNQSAGNAYTIHATAESEI